MSNCCRASDMRPHLQSSVLPCKQTVFLPKHGNFNKKNSLKHIETVGMLQYIYTVVYTEWYGFIIKKNGNVPFDYEMMLLSYIVKVELTVYEGFTASKYFNQS